MPKVVMSLRVTHGETACSNFWWGNIVQICSYSHAYSCIASTSDSHSYEVMSLGLASKFAQQYVVAHMDEIQTDRMEFQEPSGNRACGKQSGNLLCLKWRRHKLSSTKQSWCHQPSSSDVTFTGTSTLQLMQSNCRQTNEWIIIESLIASIAL